MKKVLLILSCMIAITAQATVVNYTADDTSIFPNPERGFITMLDKSVTKKSPNLIKGQESTLDYHMQKDHITLILAHYYLSNFRATETLPEEILKGFDEDMQVLREKGLKCIVRFSYTNGTYETNNGDESAKDAPLNIVQSHISQLKSHWQQNADVIFVFQAGIVGAWGEWYYTDNYGNKRTTMNANRKAVVNALLDAVPQDRCIQLRTPLFKTSFIGNRNPLTASEAFTGTPKARLGHHNDAFLENYGDMGTYQDTAQDKAYLAEETLYVPIGGESCILDDNVAVSNASYAKTTAEMSRLHWTFIQSGYSTVVTNRWRSDGTFDELNRKMGYRYQLISATLPETGAAGGKANIRLEIRNSGYAPLYNERHAYIVFKNGNKTYSSELQTDPRRWLPNGNVTVINEQITLPEMPAGDYQMYLHMPDAYASLASKTAYSIRFANNGVWDASTGMNKLNASIQISSDLPPVSDDVVELPGTLNKDNMSATSSDMTWYETDYFDFGPSDGENTERWAEWTVSLLYPGKYIISELMDSPDGLGHSWHLQLLNPGGDAIAEYTTQETWDKGEITNSDKWDLSGIAKGTYLLRVNNATQWGQPKLKSLSIDYDGEIPSAVEHIQQDLFIPLDENAPMYDVLGRPVNNYYRGIIIQNGRKYIQL